MDGNNEPKINRKPQFKYEVGNGGDSKIRERGCSYLVKLQNSKLEEIHFQNYSSSCWYLLKQKGTKLGSRVLLFSREKPFKSDLEIIDVESFSIFLCTKESTSNSCTFLYHNLGNSLLETLLISLNVYKSIAFLFKRRSTLLITPTSSYHPPTDTLVFFFDIEEVYIFADYCFSKKGAYMKTSAF